MNLTQAFTRHRTLRAGSVDTYVAEAGDGPPILLLHGNPDTHTVWSEVVARLAPRFRCITPDLPGFGRSRAPDGFDCSLENQAAFVRNLLNALELDRVHLVVHDIGGTYGLAFAAQDAPRLNTLTIFNTSFFPDYRWHFWARIWRARLLGELAMAIMNRPLFVRELRRGSRRIPDDYALHAYDQLTPAAKRMILRWYRAMSSGVLTGWDERMLAATAKTPKQTLWGDLDPYIPLRMAERYGGEVHHQETCGHWAMLEEPERAAALIASFVSRHT